MTVPAIHSLCFHLFIISILLVLKAPYSFRTILLIYVILFTFPYMSLFFKFFFSVTVIAIS